MWFHLIKTTILGIWTRVKRLQIVSCSINRANSRSARVSVDVSQQLDPLFSQSLAEQRRVGLPICEGCLFNLGRNSVLDFLVQNFRAHEVAFGVLGVDRHVDLGKIVRGYISKPVVLAPCIGPHDVVLSDSLADELLVEFDTGFLKASRTRGS